jgi:hypothetical protein
LKDVIGTCFNFLFGRNEENGSESMGKNSVENIAQLYEQERHLIQMIRQMEYGELHIFITEGKPIRVEEIKKSIKL